MRENASFLVWKVKSLPFQMACWEANTARSRGRVNFMSSFWDTVPTDSLLLFFLLPPIHLHTHTNPFSFCYRTGQGKEGGSARKFVGQCEVLLFHFCNWSKRDSQCTVRNLAFTNMTWNKGRIARKHQQFAFESSPSTNARLEPYPYWSSGSPCTTVWWSEQDGYWVISPKAHVKLVT